MTFCRNCMGYCYNFEVNFVKYMFFMNAAWKQFTECNILFGCRRADCIFYSSWRPSSLLATEQNPKVQSEIFCSKMLWRWFNFNPNIHVHNLCSMLVGDSLGDSCWFMFLRDLPLVLFWPSGGCCSLHHLAVRFFGNSNGKMYQMDEDWPDVFAEN